MAPETKDARCGHVLSLCLYSVAVATASWNYRGDAHRVLGWCIAVGTCLGSVGVM